VLHDAEPTDLSVSVDGEFDHVTDPEVRLIESYLGDLIQAVLLAREEER
jgi:hypothetical protein